MFYFSVYPSSVYAVIFTASFWCWLAFEIWVFSRDRGRQKRNARGGSAIVIALVIGILLALNAPALAPGFNIRDGYPAVFAIGILLVWAGLLFRFWSIQTLGRLFSTQLVVQDRHELVTTGPYAHLRNPSYTAALATFIGMGLGIGNWLSVAALFIAPLVVYIFRIRVEEKMLLEAFGPAFESYKKRAWALIPFIW